MELFDALRTQVGRAVGGDWSEAPVTRLKQDASNRSYFRVGEWPRSHVVMVMPVDGAKRSEEGGAGQTPTELPFLDVHRYLSRIRVRVPAITRYDEPAGHLVLEDLGDETFEKAQARSADARLSWYGEAVRLLARLRVEAERAPDPSCIAFNRTFDAALYQWEFHHFREYGLEAWSGVTLQGEERATLDRLFRELAAELAAAPVGFTHRDYQSRNLMVKDGLLVVIDFQDALLGPRQYDLVALLKDSYVELSDELVDTLIDEYLVVFETLSGEPLDAARFKAFFHLLTVQRKLKDAARFEFINRVKGNPSFLPSIPLSLRHVRGALDRLPHLDGLRRVVARYVPELS